MIENRGVGFGASYIAPAFFVWAAGQAADDPKMLEKLHQAFDAGGIEFVRSLVWRSASDPGRCWFCHADWALSYDQLSV